nr:helix-turn-helix transcriptional regulator [Nocardiopsis trehalosi]
MASPPHIGERLARLRAWRGMTQEELAFAAGTGVDVRGG